MFYNRTKNVHDDNNFNLTNGTGTALFPHIYVPW